MLTMTARRLLEQEQPAYEDPVLGVIELGNAGRGEASEERDLILASHNGRE